MQVGPKAGEVVPLLRTRFGLSSIEDLLALKPEQLQENLTVDLGHVVSFFLSFFPHLFLFLRRACGELLNYYERKLKTGEIDGNKKNIHMDTQGDVRLGAADDVRGRFFKKSNGFCFKRKQFFPPQKNR